MAKYWWSSSIDKWSLHWISWDNLATPKEKGGMGFRDLGNFNLALLGKQGCRLLTHSESLCSRVPKGKYFPGSEFMQAGAPKSYSATWKAIIAGRKALDMGLIKQVGSGTTISIWNNQWIPSTLTHKPMGHLGNDPLVFVSELIDQTSGQWDVQFLRRNFLAPDATAILNIPLRAGGGEDQLVWTLERSGEYSVKTAYRSLVTRNEHNAHEEGMVSETSS